MRGGARDDEDHEATLAAYERAKRATLHDVGRGPLVRELARLEAFLERADETPPWTDVDVGFREAKARVLRSILREDPEDP